MRPKVVPLVPKLLLSVADWLDAEISPPDFLMGEVFHSESRAFLIAPTGLGKTSVSMALAASIADGTDFLHWKAHRKARVLYIDGEMSKRLVKMRLADVVRRHGTIPEGLFVLSRSTVEGMPPLNTPAGQDFVEAIISETRPDLIVFDNVMSLLDGSMREEDPFAGVKAWVHDLTRRSIAQIWVHHTGLDQTRGYGDSTKEWTFDTVMLMKRITGRETELAFDLEFRKARERYEGNRDDFAEKRIALVDDQWTVDGIAPKAAKAKPPSPAAQKFYTELCNAINADDSSNATSTKERWKAELRRRGLLATEPEKAKSAATFFNQCVRDLSVAGWIVVDGEKVTARQK